MAQFVRHQVPQQVRSVDRVRAVSICGKLAVPCASEPNEVDASLLEDTVRHVFSFPKSILLDPSMVVEANPDLVISLRSIPEGCAGSKASAVIVMNRSNAIAKIRFISSPPRNVLRKRDSVM